MAARFWIVILFCLLGTACSIAPGKTIKKTSHVCPRSVVGEECVIERSHESIPEWALVVPEDNEYLYYIGSGSAKTLGAAQNLAYMNAILKLVRSLGVVYAVESQARFQDLLTFLDESIKGVPVIALARRAEVEEIYFVRKEVVRTRFPRRQTRVEVIVQVLTKVRYPKKEWERFQNRFDTAIRIPPPLS